MTYMPPPPSPENDLQTQRYQQRPQQGQGVFLPVDKIVEGVSKYGKFYPIVKGALRMAGFKMPPEIDEIVNAAQSGGLNPQTLAQINAAAQGEQMPNGQWQPSGVGYDPGELPPNRIGERVLTSDLVYKAWLMSNLNPKNRGHGSSVRDIALYFTNELGVPVAHSTINDNITELDEEMNAESQTRRSAAIKGAVMIVVPSVAAFVLGQVLPHIV